MMQLLIWALNPNMTKENIQRAIARGDVEFMREASDFYFKISGIYSRLCKHLANFYRYDWLITPFMKNNKASKNSEQVIGAFDTTLEYLDNFQIKKYLGEAAYATIVNGCYYGYIIHDESGA